MSHVYHFIPKSATCGGKLREYFAKQKVAHAALCDALTRWGADGPRIYGEGAQTALTGMKGKPGWKYVKKWNYYRPDTKTPEGKKIAEEMKALPTIRQDMKDLSDEILDHGLLCFSDGAGLAIHWANFNECPDGSGWVMGSHHKMRAKCKSWPSEAVEITFTEAERLTSATTEAAGAHP